MLWLGLESLDFEYPHITTGLHNSGNQPLQLRLSPSIVLWGIRSLHIGSC